MVSPGGRGAAAGAQQLISWAPGVPLLFSSSRKRTGPWAEPRPRAVTRRQALVAFVSFGTLRSEGNLTFPRPV